MDQVGHAIHANERTGQDRQDFQKVQELFTKQGLFQIDPSITMIFALELKPGKKTPKQLRTLAPYSAK